MTDEIALRRQVAELEGRVRALEAALERRSMDLRFLQPLLSAEQLSFLEAVDLGTPSFPTLGQSLIKWEEGVTLQLADVEAALLAMWGGLNPGNRREPNT
jgi:hypothetical protein